MRLVQITSAGCARKASQMPTHAAEVRTGAPSPLTPGAEKAKAKVGCRLELKRVGSSPELQDVGHPQDPLLVPQGTQCAARCPGQRALLGSLNWLVKARPKEFGTYRDACCLRVGSGLLPPPHPMPSPPGYLLSLSSSVDRVGFQHLEPRQKTRHKSRGEGCRGVGRVFVPCAGCIQAWQRDLGAQEREKRSGNLRTDYLSRST